MSKKLQANKTVNGKVMMQCRTQVKKGAIARETIDGVEHIVVSSSTLPDDIVMNGLLYPANEIKKSFMSLEDTLAPVEHPIFDGEYFSANSGRAVNAFHVGAFNRNVRQEGGRVHLEKVINVQEAMKSDKGKRLLDRIEEIETNDNARPIHTSVGVYIAIEDLPDMETNAEGQEYAGKATEMVFDHDAILLDSIGAAQPNQGVGIAVNQQGEKIKIETFTLNDQNQESQATVSDEAGDSGANDNDSPNVLDVDLTLNKQNEGGNIMDFILNALKDAGINVEGMSDEDMAKAFQDLKANKESGKTKGTEDDLSTVVANALKPLSDKLASLETQLSANTEQELDSLAELIVNSKKYPNLDVDDVKKLGVNKLKEMAANCQVSHGVSGLLAGNQSETVSMKCDIPE